jgi:flavin-binding protein dodecin
MNQRRTRSIRGLFARVRGRVNQNVMIEDGNIKGYKVNLEVTFVLDE